MLIPLITGFSNQSTIGTFAITNKLHSEVSHDRPSSLKSPPVAAALRKTFGFNLDVLSLSGTYFHPKQIIVNTSRNITKIICMVFGTQIKGLQN